MKQFQGFSEIKLPVALYSSICTQLSINKFQSIHTFLHIFKINNKNIFFFFLAQTRVKNLQIGLQRRGFLLQQHV